jgi:5'-methylthioadenosine phosphorylase
MAMVTDYDAWKVDEAHVTVEMVVANLLRNAEQAQKIVADAVRRVPSLPGCSCHNALKNALLTDKKLWPTKTKTQLKLILAKYL